MIFTNEEQTFQSDDTSDVGMLAWSRKVEQVANIKGAVNWGSLEERAHFLNRLYQFCQQKSLTFPFTVKEEKN